MNASTAFALPDGMTSLPRGPRHFGPKAAEEAAELVAGPPEALFGRLLTDQESETTLLVALHVVESFLASAQAPAPQPLDAADVAAWTAGVRREIAPAVRALRDRPRETRELVLRQRTPLTLLGACWLDTVSQAATQPSVVVNRLFGHHWLLRGEGEFERGQLARSRRSLAQQHVHVPAVESAGFLRETEARPLTALIAAFHLALSRLPASYLPEVVGVHYAMAALGTDSLLLGDEPLLAEEDVRPLVEEYLLLTGKSPTGEDDRARMLRAVALVHDLEREHVATLTELADRHDGLSLEGRVARIVERHAAFAGRQHRGVRVGKRRLADWLGDPDLDLREFVAAFRESRQMRTDADGSCRFLKSIKFGGPMFGIFDEREAAVFTEWSRAIAAGESPGLDFAPETAGDARFEERAAALRALRPGELVLEDAPAGLDDRHLLHRVVNVEQYPHILPVARRLAESGLEDAEILFRHGSGGKLTDASYFDYTPEALMERVDRVYWDKLVDPYRPLTEIPDRDEVVFQQTTYALGSLVDGAWAHRIGNLGRNDRRSDAMLFSIYADEMGRGDLAKNHITLIHQVLTSMDIHLPHIRQPEFLEQGDLPDHLYGFSLHQLCLSLFPDSLYNEILGYNLGIEMFGLGEMRLHEIQKLRRHNFDVSYEEAHLSIDNFSAGHARQSADIVVSFLEDVRRRSGEEAVQREWRRVWRGYASFAYFVEHHLVRQAREQEQTQEQEREHQRGQQAGGAAPLPQEEADLLI